MGQADIGEDEQALEKVNDGFMFFPFLVDVVYTYLSQTETVCIVVVRSRSVARQGKVIRGFQRLSCWY